MTNTPSNSLTFTYTYTSRFCFFRYCCWFYIAILVYGTNALTREKGISMPMFGVCIYVECIFTQNDKTKVTLTSPRCDVYFGMCISISIQTYISYCGHVQCVKKPFLCIQWREKNGTTLGKYCFTLLCIAKKALVTSFHFYTIATVRKATAAATTFHHLCNSEIACYHSFCLIHFAFYIHCAHIEKSSKCMRKTHAIASYWSTKVNMNNLVSVPFFNGPTT